MNSAGYCSLIIKGHKVDFEKIEKIVNLKVSKKHKEGDIYSKVVGKNTFDLISFDYILEEKLLINQALELLVDKVQLLKSNYIDFLVNYEVYFKCYIQSDYYQISFKLSADIMGKISQLGIPLEVSILSWGGVEE